MIKYFKSPWHATYDEKTADHKAMACDLVIHMENTMGRKADVVDDLMLMEKLTIKKSWIFERRIQINHKYI